MEIGEVSGVCELVQIDDMVVRIFIDEKTDHMTAYEAGTAGNDYAPLKSITYSSFVGCCYLLLYYLASMSLIMNGLSKSFSSGCAVSFLLRIADSAGICQSMPMLSSRMLMPPSDSG